MSLSFDDFFEDVWDSHPYPWQSALSRRVAEEGWPAVLDLPTGSGKTAVLDIALHHLIVDGGRSAPRRIVLVVDRRVIVDQVADRAKRLRERIEGGATATLAQARDVLREMVGERAPILECPILRGGMLPDHSWARFPHVPVLAASTVDQVGSRLLFRGYGVGPRSRPIHAGLLGCDTLFLLDEVHLARPFADLLDQLDAVRGGGGHVPRRTGVVCLSATPGRADGPDAHFGLTELDREALAPILEASKPTTLEEVKVGGRSPEPRKRAILAAHAAEVARGMISEGRMTVAVVVNRVDTARRVWSALEKDPEYDRELVTGRMRPLDQEAVLKTISRRVSAGRKDDGEGNPLIVISTQSLETGADFDFDGLVTECASLDALRQRFGRLDRRGKIGDRIDLGARAVILARSDLTEDDPVYGVAAMKTWEWLQGLHERGLDFGISALEPHLEGLSSDELGELLAPWKASPVVMPTYLELWAQTNPPPHADPDVALFLHGISGDRRGATADVRVVWRADVTKDDLWKARNDANALAERVATVPPGSLEALSLPVWTVRRWLNSERDEDAADNLSDAEGISADEETVVWTPSEDVLVLDWRGPGDTEVVRAQDVRPGATIIAPADYGGIAEHRTFDPDVIEPVVDLGDDAQHLQRGRPTLRIDDRVWPDWDSDRLADLRAASSDETFDLKAAVRALLEEARTPSPESRNGRRFETLRKGLLGAFNDVRLVETSRSEAENAAAPRPETWVLIGPIREKEAHIGEGVDLLGGNEDDESFLDSSAKLEPHLHRVARVAEGYGRRLLLPEELLATLRWVGLVHDVGKIDPRFQAMLYGGDPVAGRFGEPLAKSAIPAPDRRVRERARRLAGYPPGQRHEMVSLDMIEGSEELRAAVEADGGDWELVLHLVASHHGWARPFAPVAQDPDVADVVEWGLNGIQLQGTTGHRRERLDSGVSRRFFAVGRRYGWHEVAYLEAILRLADHRVSEGVE